MPALMAAEGGTALSVSTSGGTGGQCFTTGPLSTPLDPPRAAPEVAVGRAVGAEIASAAASGPPNDVCSRSQTPDAQRMGADWDTRDGCLDLHQPRGRCLK